VLGGAAALEQLRQRGENRRRVAPCRWRLADRQSDLALRHCKACDRVHDQQHVIAPVSEVFRNRGGGVGGARAHQRRLVRGRRHDDRALQARRAQVLLDELEHLAAALSDQRDDVDVGLHVARDHAQQGALAHAAAGENADPLSAPYRQQAVDALDAGFQHAADA
jgi:hypothetical protein